MKLLLAVFAAALTLSSRVNDLAGVMRPSDKDALEQELADLERTDSTQVVLLVVPSTGGEAIEDFALRVGRENGIGQRGKNNGILVVVAVNDRRCRIEVGYGLEGKVPDTVAALIIQHEMVPRFRSGDYSGGARAGTEAVIRSVRGEYRAPPDAGRQKDRVGWPFAGLFFVSYFLGTRRWWLPLAFTPVWVGALMWLLPGTPLWMAFVASLPIALVMMSFSRFGRGRSGFWGYGGSSSGGSSFSGGFSGGGGSFGGGGASGSW